MWAEIIGSITGTLAIGGGYYGLYKLGYYTSRKEQEHRINERIKDIEDIIKMQNDLEKEQVDLLKEHKQELLEHIEKLNNHKIIWKKKQ